MMHMKDKHTLKVYMGRYKLAGFFGVIWFDLRALNSRVEGSPHEVVPRVAA